MSASKKSNIPVVTLKDMVVFPQGVQPLFIGTPKSIKALNVATSSENNEGKKEVLLLAKRKSTKQNPQAKDLFEIGTVATVLQLAIYGALGAGAFLPATMAHRFKDD